MIDDCTALVLAGGDARRMGRDKARLPLGGQPLLQRVATVLQQIFPRIVVSVRTPQPDLEWPQVCDDSPAGGPLAGLAAGLSHADTPWVFAVACDMPFIAPAVIEQLARRRAGYQAVVPVVHGHAQPLAAFYARACLSVVRENLAGGGKHSFRAVLEQLRVCYVPESELLAADPQLQSFFDLDTPQDVARAEEQCGMQATREAGGDKMSE